MTVAQVNDLLVRIFRIVAYTLDRESTGIGSARIIRFGEKERVCRGLADGIQLLMLYRTKACRVGPSWDDVKRFWRRRGDRPTDIPIVPY